MKTPIKDPFLKINKEKHIFHSFQKNITNRNYNTTKKNKDPRLYDEIELKDKIINENHKKIRRIKIDSIKQLVYANKNVPDNWKKKREYPTQVLEILAKDTKFLNYVGKGGSGGNGSDSSCMSKSYNSFKNNKNNNTLTNYNNYFAKNNNKYLKTCSNINKENNTNFRNKFFNALIPKKKNNITKYCHKTPKKRRYISLKDKSLNEKEIINIMDELQINYPIKEKLDDLFPAEELQKIKIKNLMLKTQKNKSKSLKLHCPYLKTEKSKNIIKDNIFVNLISSYKNIKTKNDDIFIENDNSKKYSDDPGIFLMKLKKEISKRPVVNKHLERINFYGPFFSYCPPCGVRNLNFYEKLPLHQLIRFTNIIKNYRKRK